MKKLAMLGIIGGAAILTAAPLSLQWSQKNVVLSLDSAKAGTATSAAGVSRRVHRRAYRRAAYATAAAGSGGYGYSSLANCGGEYLALPHATSRSRITPVSRSQSSTVEVPERWQVPGNRVRAARQSRLRLNRDRIQQRNSNSRFLKTRNYPSN